MTLYEELRRVLDAPPRGGVDQARERELLAAIAASPRSRSLPADGQIEVLTEQKLNARGA